MNLTVSEKENVTVIELEGNLLGENDSKPIREIVEKAIENNRPNFIFHVEKLKYLNSTGLSILINTLMKARKNGGELCLVKIQPQLNSLLEITKLDKVIPRCESVETATKKLNKK